MRIRWHGQSAYTLTGAGLTVAIDPLGDLGALLGSGRRLAYPPVPEHDADLLLVTHEHRDHNAVELITGDPHVVRSTAGRFETPAGEVVAIASGHDDTAGTSRGPNTIFVYRTAAIDFLEPADEFLAVHERVAESGPEHLLERNGAHGTTVLHMAPPEARG